MTTSELNKILGEKKKVTINQSTQLEIEEAPAVDEEDIIVG